MAICSLAACSSMNEIISLHLLHLGQHFLRRAIFLSGEGAHEIYDGMESISYDLDVLGYFCCDGEDNEDFCHAVDGLHCGILT